MNFGVSFFQTFLCSNGEMIEGTNVKGTYTSHAVPNSNKVNSNVLTKCSLELLAHFPPIRSVIFVKLIGEIDLCCVVSRQEPNFVKHACKTANSVCTARESQKTYSISFNVVLHDELVGTFDMNSEATTNLQNLKLELVRELEAPQLVGLENWDR
jgi:hypothetical protein